MSSSHQREVLPATQDSALLIPPPIPALPWPRGHVFNANRRQPTEDDITWYGIDQRYNFEHWNAVSPPIVLEYNVFDSRTLGQWFLEWTMVHTDGENQVRRNARILYNTLDEFSTNVELIIAALPTINDPGLRNVVWSKFDDCRTLLKEMEFFLEACCRAFCRTLHGGFLQENIRLLALHVTSNDRGFKRNPETPHAATESILNSMKHWNFQIDNMLSAILRYAPRRN
ncbi:hypothetical protein F5Y19DRAFT_473888 [Xylariaceae sp. FL1651]|nr:hypothetical protein F5Y19DRAFT_473888 [Xylariaceae sp. FL1651]